MKEHLLILLLFNFASFADDNSCEVFTLCNSCTEMPGDSFRPIARGCVWCEKSFKSFCAAPDSNNCTIANRKTFGKCGFSWIPVVIIVLIFGCLFFVYGTFIMIIKQCEYNKYKKVNSKNDVEAPKEMVMNVEL
ncbi:hypothetical protein EIN_505170 [Entamoeba invadens IP1]|uniref:Uncharacterized protein n=1 Tax=Entamoeba invadens IP1 TaxID=370355 RepID=A0A0A1U7E2_ENTIV|nr:hypothetical protein EIN_505170 [Entamoeba invadens IP1]ELP90311.1 hypothetical protein EIN_505170 [Entamoeba invadens IP1]|eukprot:XP_004257082.1 hypothetical protein EIN_505170 [Entamoeba invadens IP1]